MTARAMSGELRLVGGANFKDVTCLGRNMMSTFMQPVVECIEVDASPEDIYRAIENPEFLADVWSLASANCVITKSEVDLRQGGTYSIESKTKRGNERSFTGQFLYVSPKLIAFTWRSDQSKFLASVVYVSIMASQRSGRTSLGVEHHDLVSERERNQVLREWRHLLQVVAKGFPRLTQELSPDVKAFLERHPACT